MSQNSSTRRYAMLMFDRHEQPENALMDIFDMLKKMNPVSSRDLSYPQFLALYDEWRMQQKTPGVAVETKSSNETSAIAKIEIASEIPIDDDTSIMTVIIKAPNESSEPVVIAPTVVNTGAGQSPQPGVADYMVVSEFMLDRFVEKVNELLLMGWSPLGGITRSAATSGPGYYLQAMVKHGEPSKQITSSTDTSEPEAVTDASKPSETSKTEIEVAEPLALVEDVKADTPSS